MVNSAIAGRSARSYTDEGRFTTLINTVKSGDYVVIEFGHNDGEERTHNATCIILMTEARIVGSY